MQLKFSLVARDVESEHFPAAGEGGMGVMPWSPLAGGFLAGKYQRGNTAGAGRLSGANPFGDSKFTDRNWAILDVLKAVAAELDRPMAQVALAWTLARSGVASTLIGASKLSQLESNIAATDLRLDDAQMKRLDEVSAPPEGFSSSLTSPFIRRMVFGGHDVVGWGE
jgi:aryl-alcohol dehydrogenase-like predicted oxidoreductase